MFYLLEPVVIRDCRSPRGERGLKYAHTAVNEDFAVAPREGSVGCNIASVEHPSDCRVAPREGSVG